MVRTVRGFRDALRTESTPGREFSTFYVYTFIRAYGGRRLPMIACPISGAQGTTRGTS